MTFYCTADGTAPTAPVDWAARQATVDAVLRDVKPGDTQESLAAAKEAAQDVLDAERRALASHFIRNGNGPRTLDLSASDVAEALKRGKVTIVVGDSLDRNGGGVASLVLADGSMAGTLRCPECLELARAVEAKP